MNQFEEMGYDCSHNYYVPVDWPEERYLTYKDMIAAHPEIRDQEGTPYRISRKNEVVV